MHFVGIRNVQVLFSYEGSAKRFFDSQLTLILIPFHQLQLHTGLQIVTAEHFHSPVVNILLFFHVVVNIVFRPEAKPGG